MLMQSKHMTRAVFTLLVASSILGIVFITAVSAQSGPVDQPEQTANRLDIISEMTGFQASLSPISEECTFSQEYEVYLCETPGVVIRGQSEPRARVRALNLLNSSGLLFIPDSTNKRIMAFDPETGDLIDPDFILLDDAATGTVIHAILGPTNNILVSDQTRDIVHEYDLEGNYLGTFAPAGGANTDILDNIRGMALRPNGNLLVTVGAGPNADAIAEFDTTGNYLGNFVANGSGGLDSPFDVYERRTVDWLAGGSDSDAIHRYHLDTGAPIGTLSPVDTFPQQIYEAANSNILVANFSGTQAGIMELTADGTVVDIYNPPQTSFYRGIFELPNGNLLTTTSGGVFEIDRSGTLVDIKITGQSRYIEFVSQPGITLQKTVGTDAGTCATTDEISVTANTTVYYCFEVTNNTTITLTRHDLVDSHLGVILDDFNFALTPQSSAFITQSVVITETTVNSATWTAYNPGPIDVFSAESWATVHVVEPAISLAKTVGTDPALCATSGEVTVLPGTAVTYCYEVTNTGEVTLSRHDLVDSQLGTILDSLPFDLMPGSSAFVTQTAVIVETTTNLATWTAYNPGPIDVVAANASATAFVVTPSISLSATVGTEPGTCADTDAISVLPGTIVYYCYTVTNDGDLPFADHTITDTVLGQIDSFAFDLQPGMNAFFIYSQTIVTDVISTVTWLAESDLYAAEADDSVTVEVVLPVHAVSLTALEAELPGLPGTAVTFDLQVKNEGNVPDSFELTFADNDWNVVLSAVTSGLLPPGGSFNLTVSVTIPAGVAHEATDSVVVTATSTGDTAASDQLVLSTTAVWHQIYLPLAVKP